VPVQATESGSVALYAVAGAAVVVADSRLLVKCLRMCLASGWTPVIVSDQTEWRK
jgi:hypothetical protein